MFAALTIPLIAQAIRDWLHSIPTSLNPAEIRRGYQAYTKNKLKQARRTGAAVPRGLVDELDPDAVSRGKGVARLDGEDAVRNTLHLTKLYLFPLKRDTSVL